MKAARLALVALFLASAQGCYKAPAPTSGGSGSDAVRSEKFDPNAAAEEPAAQPPPSEPEPVPESDSQDAPETQELGDESRDPSKFVCEVDVPGRGRHMQSMGDYADGVFAGSVEDCCQLCAELKGCQALNFHLPEPGFPDGLCFPKAEAVAVNGPAGETRYESAVLIQALN